MKKILLLTSLLATVGCSSTGQYHMVTAPVLMQSSYETVNINVVSNSEEGNEVAGDVKSVLAGQLLADGHFHRVSQDNPNINVTVNITDFNKVGRVKMILLGALAGKNEIDGNVIVTDTAGKLLKNFDVMGQSSYNQYSTSSEYGTALKEFAKNVSHGVSE